MKHVLLLLYNWGSVFLFIGLIFWLATLPYLVGGSSSAEVTKVIYRIFLYATLVILIYRAIIISLKGVVDRLSYWRSKQEKIEDAEFAQLIELLALVTAVMSSIVVVLFEEFIQMYVSGREASFIDIMVSILAILFSAIIAYVIPLLGELEIFIYERYLKDQ